MRRLVWSVTTGVLVLASCGRGAVPANSPSGPSSTAPSVAASASVATSPAIAKPSAATTASPASAASSVTIVYATDAGPTTPAWVGVEQGFYKKYGLDVTTSHTEGTLTVNALASNSAQAGVNGGAEALAAIAAGTPIKLVMVLIKENPYAIVVRPDIKSPNDLRGQSLAISKIGDTSDIAAHIALSRFGLDAGKDVVERQIGGSPARFAALQSGQVAAAIMDQAFTDTLVKQGYPVLVNLAQEKVPFIAYGLAVSGKFAQEQPKTVAAMVRGTYDGLQYALDPKNKQRVLEIMGKYQQTNPNDPKMQPIYDSMVAGAAPDPTPELAGAETILKALQGMDPTRYAKVAASDLIDPSFMHQAKAG